MTIPGRLPSVLLATALAAGCGDGPSEPRLDHEAPVQTEAPSYSMIRTASGAEAMIDFVFTNQSSQRISFPNCRGAIQLIVERQSETGWEFAFGPGYPDCLGPPVHVAPGGTASGSTSVFQYDLTSSFCCGFAEGTAPPGTYRIRIVEAVYNYDDSRPFFGDPVEARFLVSNRFRIN